VTLVHYAHLKLEDWGVRIITLQTYNLHSTLPQENYMFKKYNDTPAAIAIALVTVFFILQVVLFGSTAGTFLEEVGIGQAALPMAYWLCFLFAAMAIGLILTFVKGPDGQSIFFNVVLITQIGGVVGNLIEISTDAVTKSSPGQLVMFIVVAILYCFGYFRVRSRL